VLAGNGLGNLRIGMSVVQLRAVCNVTRDSTVAHGNEGLPERRIAVAIGMDTLEALVESHAIRRLEITTPRFRTTDSLGVGSRADALRSLNATLAFGDRGVFALVPAHCGLSFHLAGVGPTQQSWSQIADSTRVDRVLAFGC